MRLENYFKKVGGKEEHKEIQNDTKKEGHSLQTNSDNENIFPSSY